MHEVFLNRKHLADLIDFIGMSFVANQRAFVKFIFQNPFDSRTRPQKPARDFRRVAHGFLFHLLVLIEKRRFHSLRIELMCDIFQPKAFICVYKCSQIACVSFVGLCRVKRNMRFLFARHRAKLGEPSPRTVCLTSPNNLRYRKHDLELPY